MSCGAEEKKHAFVLHDFNTGLNDIVEGDMKRSRTLGTTTLIDSDILKSVVKKSIVMSDFESLLFADESRFVDMTGLIFWELFF